MQAVRSSRQRRSAIVVHTNHDTRFPTNLRSYVTTLILRGLCEVHIAIQLLRFVRSRRRLSFFPFLSCLIESHSTYEGTSCQSGMWLQYARYAQREYVGVRTATRTYLRRLQPFGHVMFASDRTGVSDNCYRAVFGETRLNSWQLACIRWSTMQASHLSKMLESLAVSTYQCADNRLSYTDIQNQKAIK